MNDEKRKADTEQKNQVGIGSHLYFEAMVFLMNKQTRIIENDK